MFCYNCGASQPDNTSFCSNCGRSTTGPGQAGTAPQQGATAQPTATASGAAAAPAPGVQPSPPVSNAPWLNVPPPAQRPQQPVYAGQAQTDGKATGSLILGILSLLCFSFLAGIPAIILGHISRKNIRQSMGRLKGDGMAMAGLIMGYISVAFIPIMLIIAAIAIPNLLRAKMSANNSAAASSVRTINTAEVTYSTNYPGRGYAADLSALGPGASDTCTAGSETNACLIDRVLAGGFKNGFRYNLIGVCGTDGVCTDYVILATPVNNNTGSESFCSTSDAVIRFNKAVPLVSPPTTVEECQAWPPIV